MSTINISLPQEQVSFIDALVSRYGFANRSEFVRSLVRLIHSKPRIAEEAIIHPFLKPTPPNQSVRDVVAAFKNTKKYSNEFLKDLEIGLKRSNYFKP